MKVFHPSFDFIPSGFVRLEHPSSDLASLGHLLPQGEKVGVLHDRLCKSPTLVIGRGVDAVLHLLPLWEKVPSEARRMRGVPARRGR
jgi:hypothetical protein